jgi:hypothetical protein
MINNKENINIKKRTTSPKVIDTNGTKSKLESTTTTPDDNNINLTMIKDEAGKYVIWRRPISTIYLFLRELIDLLIEYFVYFLTYRKLVAFSIFIIGLITLGFNIEGAHLQYLQMFKQQTIVCLYWLGLGIASSIGLGTGLHTFLLYLGPFIAQVTIITPQSNLSYK